MKKTNLKPLLLKLTIQEREMLQALQRANGLSTETAVVRKWILTGYMELVRRGLVKEKEV